MSVNIPIEKNNKPAAAVLVHPSMSYIARDVLESPDVYIGRDYDPRLCRNGRASECARRKAVVALHATRNRNAFLLDRVHEAERELQDWIDSEREWNSMVDLYPSAPSNTPENDEGTKQCMNNLQIS